MATHKGKMPVDLPRREAAARPRSGKVPVVPIQTEPIPGSFEEFSRARFEKLPQKSNLSSGDVEKTFLGILERMGLKINSLVVGVRRAETLVQVSFNAARDVRLDYDDYF